MAKDPAFLFYPSDWLGGTLAFTRHEKGAYIDLMIAQFNLGHMLITEIEQILGNDYPRLWEEKLKKKYKVDAEGKFFNERLEEEILRRKNYSKSRKLNRTYVISYDTDMSAHMETETVNGSEIEFVLKTLFKNDGEGAIALWRIWKDYKLHEHRERYKTLKTETLAVKKLHRLSDGNLEVATAIVNESMENQWKGLFQLKQKPNGTYQQTSNNSAVNGTSAARIERAKNW